MRVLVLALLVAACAASCNVTRIVECMETHLDRDGDGQLNATEIDLHMLEQPCGPVAKKVMGSSVMDACDFNQDGYITLEDLQHEPVSCVTNQRMQLLLCQECDACDAALLNPTIE